MSTPTLATPTTITMAPRQRKASNRPLPPNVRERDGYYTYRNPEDGVEYGLGRNQRDAIGQAIEANMKLAGKIARPRLVDRLTGEESRTWGRWCDEFEKILRERDGAVNTQRVRGVQLARVRRTFESETPAASIDTLACSDALKAIKAEGKARTAQAFRSFLIDCFDRMIAGGWRKDNPARLTDEVKVKVKRARLTLEIFNKVYEHTELVWLRNAIALAIISGQARESVIDVQFPDVHDGAWWNERGKTGARIVLPLELRLDCLDMSLEDVVRQCRTTGVLSKHLIHQTQRAKGARLGMKINPTMLTRKFSLEITNLGLDWGGKNPPTFHEIRSLSSRLYKAEGRVNPQELLGHKDPRTTAVYTDGRGEWVRVSFRT
jgi:integrase